MTGRVNWDRVVVVYIFFYYKPLSDFGPLGRNRALPSCHSSMYQQRDEEPSSLERGGRAQQQETIREKEGGGERRRQIEQTSCFTVHPLREEGVWRERQKNSSLQFLKTIPNINLWITMRNNTTVENRAPKSKGIVKPMEHLYCTVTCINPTI